MRSSVSDDVVELSDVRFSWHAASLPVVAIDALRVPRGERLMDPFDFFVPQVWSPGDARWANPAKAARFAQLCN